LQRIFSQWSGDLLTHSAVPAAGRELAVWRTGLAMLRIVFGERLDFVRRYAGGHQVALLAALADDKVRMRPHDENDQL
jgi:hypothetical protein